MALNQLAQIIRTSVGTLSPRRRRWRRFLREFQLAPDQLPSPLDAPGDQDFIICGSPRSGTTLLSAMLFQPPQVVTVMEPWDGMRLPPAQLFASLRREIEETGRLCRGKLDVHALLQEGEVRWNQEGSCATALTTSPDFRLGVKWPAFWQYLDRLPRTKFLVCVRHPFETISSYKQKGGRLAQGLDYEIGFNRRFNKELEEATSDVATRRILLYARINDAVCRHIHRQNVFVVHYERWFADSETLVAEIGRFLGLELPAGPAVIRPSRREMDLTSMELHLIRQRCASAQTLGYELVWEPEREREVGL